MTQLTSSPLMTAAHNTNWAGEMDGAHDHHYMLDSSGEVSSVR